MTDLGKVRTNNEDFFICDEESALFAVADGMGGHNAGEVASKQAVEILQKNIKNLENGPNKNVFGSVDKKISERANLLASSIRIANTVIYQSARSSPDKKGMGTTIAALSINKKEKKASYANVGDSRIYLFSNGELRQLTEDHTVVAEQLKMGIITSEEAKVSQYQNMLSRALGTSETVDVDAADCPAEDGSIFLLCSDGLTRMVDDEKISEIISRNADEPAKTLKELIDTANENGGRDNITALIVRVESTGFFKSFFS